MTDLDRMRRAMLLDPYDLLAQHAYRDAWIDAGHEDEPRIITHWVCSLDKFLLDAWETFSQHPVIEVALTGCLHKAEGFGGSVILHGLIVDTDPSASWAAQDMWTTIPQCLADHLVYERCMPRSAGRFWYSSQEAATVALSRAALNYGRSLANLPPLPV